MEQGKVHIDDLFHQKAQPLFALPPAAWDDMKLRLDKGRPERGFPYRWLWYALSLLFVAGIGVYFLQSHPGQSAINMTASTPATVVAPGNSGDLEKGDRAAKSAISKEPASSPKRAWGFTDTVATSILEISIAQKEESNTAQKLVKQSDPTLFATRRAKTIMPHAAHLVSGKNANVAEMDVSIQKNGMQAVQDTATIKKATTAKPADVARNTAGMPELPGRKSTQDVVTAAPAVGTLKANATSLKTAKEPALVSTKAPEGYATDKNPKALPVSKMPPSVPETAQVVTNPTTPHIVASRRDSAAVATEKSAGTPIITSITPKGTDSSASQKLRKSKPFLDFGIKAGYEAGTGQPSVNKFLAAPYLQYHIGAHFSVGLQPGIKWGRASGITAPDGTSYYNLTGTTVDSQTITKNGRPFWQITYTHNYDSITVSYVTVGSTIEVEVPLILRYQLKNGLSFGTGMDLAFGKLITTEEQRQLAHLAQSAVFQIEKAGTHPPPDTSKSFHHTAPSYATYNPLGQAAQSPVRIGYVVSASYERKRWLIETCLQQTLSGLSGVKVQSVKDAYSLPYLRILVGYRLSEK